jgi:hypothetical protein
MQRFVDRARNTSVSFLGAAHMIHTKGLAAVSLLQVLRTESVRAQWGWDRVIDVGRTGSELKHTPPQQHIQGEPIGLLALSTLINHTAMGEKERRHTTCERYLWRKDTEPPNGIRA